MGRGEKYICYFNQMKHGKNDIYFDEHLILIQYFVLRCELIEKIEN
jgi:hypothetical protein